MDYEYIPLRREIDPNRCCAGWVWCIRDICGIVCAVLTWLLILFAEFVVMTVILLPYPYTFYSVVNGIIFHMIGFLAITSHLRTMLTDPGSVPKGNATKEMIQHMGCREGQVIFKCQKCCSIKPERAHHCSVCQRVDWRRLLKEAQSQRRDVVPTMYVCINRKPTLFELETHFQPKTKKCIRKMDHHCPWVNNCVGEDNQKFFVLFTLYIACMSLHSLLLAAQQFISCIDREWRNCSNYSPPTTVILLVFLVFEALLFAIFTSAMFFSQLQAIWNDETGIEQLKKEEARWAKKSRWKSIQAVFGRFSLAWFSPFIYPPPRTPRKKADYYLFSV